jgi:translation initiation factor IF-3
MWYYSNALALGRGARAKSGEEGISVRGQRINQQIRSPQVRLIDEDGKQLGILPISEALAAAQQRGLDLVEVAPQATPPVCRLMDYGKFRYTRAKRERSARRTQKSVEMKEVRLRPKTDEHDLQVIMRRARSFLGDGSKVKVRVRFRGREIVNSEVAQAHLERIAQELSDVGSVESRPQMDGRTMLMILAPNKSK